MLTRLSILFTCIVCSITSTNTLGQSGYYLEEPKVFSGGLIVGANFSQVDGDSFYGYHKVGIHAGGIVYVHFSQKFGASMELIYTEKGSRGEQISESVAIGTYVEKYYMNLNYVEVPVTIHYKIGKLDADAGMSYARLVSSKEWILADKPANVDPISNAFSNTDVTYIVGISAKVHKHLHAGFRFQYSAISIRPIEKVPAGFSYGNQGQFNNLLCLRVAYMF